MAKKKKVEKMSQKTQTNNNGSDFYSQKIINTFN